jgi:hypothetical protein
MKKSEILKEARKLIEARQERFICLAILSPTLAFKENEVHIDSLERWIQVLLGKHATYDQWLHFHHPNKVNQLDNYYTEARLQWMDWMIQYWKAKGD